MMIKKVKLKARGKINYSLNVLGENSGMHMLDMVLTSVNLADVITVFSRLDSNVNISFKGIEIDPSKTVVFKAVQLLKEKFGDFGADIFIDSVVPSMCGMGGSSIDAGGVITALDKIYAFTERAPITPEMTLKLGSDVPYCLKGGLARVLNGGELVIKQEFSPQKNIVLIRDNFGISTKECFKVFDEIYSGKSYCPADNDALIKELINEKEGAEKHMKNALEKPAATISKGVKKNLDLLLNEGAAASFLTGSGNGCVGVFESVTAMENASNKALNLGLSSYILKPENESFEWIDF